MKFSEKRLIAKRPGELGGLDRSELRGGKETNIDFGFGQKPTTPESAPNNADILKSRQSFVDQGYNTLATEMQRASQILPKITKITQNMDNMRNFYDEYQSAAQFSNKLLSPDINAGEITQLSESGLTALTPEEWTNEKKLFNQDVENLSRLLDEFEGILNERELNGQ